MDRSIIPSVGFKGFFKLKAPFSNFMNENEQYTCQAVRSIGDYIAFNEDPLNNIYLYAGLTEAEFENDVANNTMIISLQSENGQWIYVPAPYLLSFPIMNGIPYRTMMLGVSLGPVSTNLNLDAISELISNVVYENLGIRPAIKPIALSKPKLIDSSSHEMIETARLQRAVMAKTDYGRYKDMEAKYLLALEKIKILEDFITSKNLV